MLSTRDRLKLRISDDYQATTSHQERTYSEKADGYNTRKTLALISIRLEKLKNQGMC